MRDNPEVHEHLPLTPLTLHVLIALAARAAHGYAIVKAVRSSPIGGMSPGTGTFYSAIRRMQEDGLVAEVPAPPDRDSRRRYYALTELGNAVLQAEVERLQLVVEQARSAAEAT